MTLLEKNLGSLFGTVQFGVQRSCRYHTLRQKHFECLSKFISFSIILLSGVWGILLSEGLDSWYVFLGPSLIILFSALDITLKPSAMGMVHKSLAHQFNELEIKMIASENTDDTAKKFQMQRQTIEANEPPSRIVLNIISHNQLCQATNRADDMYHVSFLRRVLCPLIDLPPKRWELLKDRNTSKLQSPKPELQVSA